MAKADGKTRRGGDQGGGQKTAFTLEQVQLVHSLLKAKGDVMQIALLQTAVCACLRAGDLLGLRVERVTIPSAHVSPHGGIVARLTLVQEKTRAPVTVSLTDDCRAALAAWILAGNRQPNQRVFPLGREQYARIVKSWARMAHLDPRQFSTHSMRRTQAVHLYQRTGNIKAVSTLLGHKNLAHTTEYLGVTVEDALRLKDEHRVL